MSLWRWPLSILITCHNFISNHSVIVAARTCFSTLRNCYTLTFHFSLSVYFLYAFEKSLYAPRPLIQMDEMTLLNRSLMLSE
ncbi:hypothetical protein CW304_30115 [Bacillus sp. UFRGS-B20]|nr:hypothetical protein CW304_30115 [Bacillus sp. UFRGS-B20]